MAACEIVGRTLTGEKEKTISVTVDGRDVVVQIGKEQARLDRNSAPALQQLLQAAVLEVS